MAHIILLHLANKKNRPAIGHYLNIHSRNMIQKKIDCSLSYQHFDTLISNQSHLVYCITLVDIMVSISFTSHLHIFHCTYIETHHKNLYPECTDVLKFLMPLNMYIILFMVNSSYLSSWRLVLVAERYSDMRSISSVDLAMSITTWNVFPWKKTEQDDINNNTENWLC